VTRECLTTRCAAPDRRWKAVEVVVPVTVPSTQVSSHIDAQIRIIAYEAGDFVEQYRVGLEVARGGGYAKWSASYLPGAPGVFPARQDTGRRDTSDGDGGRRAAKPVKADAVPEPERGAQSDSRQNYWHLRGG
jgi:hypothetical protein